MLLEHTGMLAMITDEHTEKELKENLSRLRTLVVSGAVLGMAAVRNIQKMLVFSFPSCIHFFQDQFLCLKSLCKNQWATQMY